MPIQSGYSLFAIILTESSLFHLQQVKSRINWLQKLYKWKAHDHKNKVKKRIGRKEKRARQKKDRIRIIRGEGMECYVSERKTWKARDRKKKNRKTRFFRRNKINTEIKILIKITGQRNETKRMGKWLERN
jgi:hypothetical protein